MIELTENEKIRIGEQATWLMQTDLGRYLTARSQEEAIDALDELSQIDPYDFKKIAKLQLRKKVAEKALTWIFEIIAEADNIEEIKNSADESLIDEEV